MEIIATAHEENLNGLDYEHEVPAGVNGRPRLVAYSSLGECAIVDAAWIDWPVDNAGSPGPAGETAAAGQDGSDAQRGCADDGEPSPRSGPKPEPAVGPSTPDAHFLLLSSGLSCTVGKFTYHRAAR